MAANSFIINFMPLFIDAYPCEACYVVVVGFVVVVEGKWKRS